MEFVNNSKSEPYRVSAPKIVLDDFDGSFEERTGVTRYVDYTIMADRYSTKRANNSCIDRPLIDLPSIRLQYRFLSYC